MSGAQNLPPATPNFCRILFPPWLLLQTVCHRFYSIPIPAYGRGNLFFFLKDTPLFRVNPGRRHPSQLFPAVLKLASLGLGSPTRSFFG